MDFSMCPFHQHHPIFGHRSPFDAFDNMFEIPSRFLEDLHGQENGAIAEAGRTTGILSDQEKFRVELDVKDFKPEELQVKCVQDKFLVVEGNHMEERAEEGGKDVIKREFKRSYMIPKGVDVGKLKSNLVNGVLGIEAPKKELAITQTERPIAIEHSYGM